MYESRVARNPGFSQNARGKLHKLDQSTCLVGRIECQLIV